MILWVSGEVENITRYYIDESGDVGFAENSSKYFVLVALECDDALSLRRVLKRVRQRKLKKSVREMPELKARLVPEKLRQYVLTEISHLDPEIYVLVVRKEVVKDRFRRRCEDLYNYAMGTICAELPSRHLDLVLDKRHTSARLRDELRGWIRYFVLGGSPHSIPEKVLTISDRSSEKSAGLQMVDFIAWAIFQKYERRNEGCYQIVSNNIVIERNLPEKE